jgi:hypothetical protein
MNKDERLALEYLQHIGFQDIIHEPDGNIPPDFLIDKSIAAEVRRLNQTFETGHKKKGLEELEFPLRQKFEKLLSDLKVDTFDESYFVFFTFRRPLNVSAVLGQARNALAQFSRAERRHREEIVINRRFKLEIMRASTKLDQFFVFGGHSDLDEGGFVIPEVYRNLKICSDEKTNKVKRYKSRYPQWWLILIDYIGYGLTKDDVAQLNETYQIEHSWDKVIIVNPLDPSQATEI